jgi:hypothetical protein
MRGIHGTRPICSYLRRCTPGPLTQIPFYFLVLKDDLIVYLDPEEEVVMSFGLCF